MCVNQLLSSHIDRFFNDSSKICVAITVPNAFKDRECRILKGIVENNIKDILRGTKEISSIDVSIIPEPIAAALYFAYAMDRAGCLQDEQYVVVSDIGGGTTDLAIVKVLSYKGHLEFEVQNTEHMFELGGNDIDNNIADHIITQRPELKCLEREILVRACCELKIGFSRYNGRAHSQVGVLDNNGEFLTLNNREVVLDMSIDELRSILSLDNNFLAKYKALALRLKDKFINVTSPNVYLLPIGGTSRLQLVRDALREVFYEHNENEVTLHTEDEELGRYDSVVRGAAIYAAYNGHLISNDIVMNNRTMHRISLRYGNNKLHECILQCSSDGVYECRCKCEPIYLDEKNGTFKIGTIRFYQGGDSLYVDADCEVLCDIAIDEVLYTHGRRLEDIAIVVNLEIYQGRLRSVHICAERCMEDGEDYLKRINCNI